MLIMSSFLQGTISSILSPLHVLRIFRVHLDWPMESIIPHEAVFAGVVMDDVGGGTPQSLWGLEEYHLAAARVIALRLGPRLEEVHVMPLHADLVWRRYLVTRSSERGAIDVSFDCITANLLPP